MANIHDIAKYILTSQGEMTAMKLQKLVYYSQAWSLVWDETLLFEEVIQAWANGPVVPALYYCHKGVFKLASWDKGNIENLTDTERETIEGVLKFYSPMTSQQLSDLTHSERPWKEARVGLADGERGENVINPASMHEYYSSL